MAYESIEDHIVILGWSERVKRIILELRNDEHQASGDLKPILVVTPSRLPEVEIPFKRVYVIYGSLTEASVLERANLPRACSILIPGASVEASGDGETIFTLLAVMAVCPDARICVEMKQANHTDLMERLRFNGLIRPQIEFVAVESISERLLAQAAINPGVTRIYQHLISFTEDSNELYAIELPEAWLGRPFRDLAGHCFEKGVMLIGWENGGGMQLNPVDRGYIFQRGDRAWLIAYNKADCLRIIDPSRLR